MFAAALIVEAFLTLWHQILLYLTSTTISLSYIQTFSKNVRFRLQVLPYNPTRNNLRRSPGFVRRAGIALLICIGSSSEIAVPFEHPYKDIEEPLMPWRSPPMVQRRRPDSAASFYTMDEYKEVALQKRIIRARKQLMKWQRRPRKVPLLMPNIVDMKRTLPENSMRPRAFWTPSLSCQILDSQPCFSYDWSACWLCYSRCMGSKTSLKRVLR